MVHKADDKKHSMEKRSIRTLNLIAGWLCLDFSNTLGMHASDMGREFLGSYFDLAEWTNYAGIVTEEEERSLLDRAENLPKEAETVLHKAIELREIIFRVFSSIVKNTAPGEKDISLFNKKLSKVMRQSKLEITESGIEWNVTGNKNTLDWPLNAVIHSAFSLLTSEELGKVKMCADKRGCGWLFVDHSKNRSRRWCDMADCGNLAKQKRYYGRKHTRQILYKE
jgi:predicted RNA-binding Zn ribbon-like protein